MKLSFKLTGLMFWKNPVLIKETRTRMRGGRTFLTISIHLVLLGAILMLCYWLFIASMGSSSNMMEERRTLSRVLFGLIFGLEMVMISFTAPALTSGMISSEREMQTLDLLQVTLLSSRSLVLGKYISGLSFLLLLLFTAIPLQSPAFLVGGVTPQEIAVSTLILLVTAITFCAVGLFFSTLLSRNLISTVLSYAFAIFLIFGVPLLASLFLALFSNLAGNFITDLPLLSQVLLLVIFWFAASITPLGTIIASEGMFLSERQVWLAKIPLTIPDSNQTLNIYLPSSWIIYTLFYLALSLALLWLCIQILKRPER